MKKRTMKHDACTIVSCGILRRELSYLREQGSLDAERILYTGPGLHTKPEELEKQLTRQLARARETSDNVVVVYGDKCYIDSNKPEMTIDSIVSRAGARRVRAESCIDMLCDRDCRREISGGENVLWLTPGWLEHWKRIWQQYLGWDAADANMNFPGFYSRAVFLDPEPLGVFDDLTVNRPELILEFSDWTRLSVESRPISLDRLNALLQECIAGNEGGRSADG